MKVQHPLSVAQFMKIRPEIWNFAVEVKECSLQNKYIIINAPVKSGKKEQVFAQALLDHFDSTTKHIYVSSFYRKENENQLKEYAAYRVDVLKTHTAKEAKDAISKINIYAKNYNKIVIHIDESDYGTDKNGLLSKVFNIVCSQQNCDVRFYSATNEEAQNSRFAKFFNTCNLSFVPPENYRGAAWFLENNLVKEAEPFFNINTDDFVELTEQGKKIIDDFLLSDKPLGIVRVVGKNSERDDTNFKIIKNDVNINRFFAKNAISCEYVDSNNEFNWETKPENYNDLFISSGKKLRHLVFLNQKTVRSTEIHCHHLIHFWHDYRKLDTTYATSQQAILRVCHYGDINNQIDTKINVYSDTNIFKKAAGMISEEEFALISQRALSSRVNSYIIKKKYKFYNKIEEIPDIYRSYYDVGNAQANNSANNISDLSKIVLNNLSHTYKVIHLDGPNPFHVNSWNQLTIQHPEILQGYKYAVFEKCESLAEDVTLSTTKESMYSIH